MATNSLMPALSPTMTEGNLARWLKNEGDKVRAGDVIAEIETDKATMEVEAVDEGVLGKIVVAAAAPKPVAAAAAAPVATPAAVPVAAPVVVSGGDRVVASPLAKRMAAQSGLDLSRVAGTGPNGRIVKADVEAALAKPAAAPAPVAAAPAPKPVAATPAPSAGVTAAPNSSMRKVIARRLSESKATIPHFYVAMDIELDALLDLRAKLNARAPKDGAGAYKLSVNDLIIKAAAVTLRRIPGVAASWTEEAILHYDNIDISVAVAIPDGLITPIVKGADTKGLAAISNEMKDLGARAKSGKLKPEEFQGGCFSISNMGMYGVKHFAAIINPPQAGILAVGAGEQRPVVKNGALAVATVMTCQLSVDHRVIDGSLAAEWMAEFKRIVEDPLSLML
ncbi:MAG: 2-oxo acid dehydrogenase subunit E2 [Alphaproteobacteria bacterium]|nr:2-oxo acid dehydrogenase subunit E2 [Alphaproteobacteria bacterium]